MQPPLSFYLSVYICKQKHCVNYYNAPFPAHGLWRWGTDSFTCLTCSGSCIGPLVSPSLEVGECIRWLRIICRSGANNKSKHNIEGSIGQWSLSSQVKSVSLFHTFLSHHVRLKTYQCFDNGFDSAATRVWGFYSRHILWCAVHTLTDWGTEGNLRWHDWEWVRVGVGE